MAVRTLRFNITEPSDPGALVLSPITSDVDGETEDLHAPRGRGSGKSPIKSPPSPAEWAQRTPEWGAASAAQARSPIREEIQFQYKSRQGALGNILPAAGGYDDDEGSGVSEDLDLSDLEAAAKKGQKHTHALQYRSLFFFEGENSLRQISYWFAHRREFEVVVQTMIFANCVFLAMNDPSNDKAEFQEVAELIFLGFFTFELCLKVVAHGLILHPHSYLRNGWNRLDFAIVLIAWIAVLPFASNYSELRAFRALRPLRSINNIPGLKLIVNSLFLSVKGLLHVLSLVTFFFLVFGILGVQLFMGLFRYRCVGPDGQPPEGEEEQFCKFGDTRGGFLGRDCPDGLTCQAIGNPNFGFVHFDNVGTAWLVVFQCITLEGWVDQMYRVQDVWGALSPLYFIPLVVLGSFFLLNLALAVIFEKFAFVKERSIDERLRELLRQSEEEQMEREDPSYRDALTVLVASRGSVSNGSKRSSEEHQREDVRSSRASVDEEVSPKRESIRKVLSSPEGEPLKDPTEARARGASHSSREQSTDPSPSGRHTQRSRSSSRQCSMSLGNTTDEVSALVEATGVADAVQRLADGEGADIEDVDDSVGVRRNTLTRAGRKESLKKEVLLRRISRAHQQGSPGAGDQDAPRSPVKRESVRSSVIRRSTIFPSAFHGDQKVNPVRRAVQRVTDSPAFQWSVLGFIVVNTVLLSVEHHGQPQSLTDFLTVANYVFIGIFAAEMLLKLVAMGLRDYAKDGFNLLDGAVVIVSFVELPLSGQSSVSVFRALRLLRVFKLMKNFPSLRNLIRVILKAVAETGYLTLVIMLYLFIAALMGMRLFGAKFEPEEPGGMKPRATFNSFGWSMLTVFQILTRDDWVVPMWDAMRSTEPFGAAVYFVLLVVLGDFLFLNLFLAILISSFDRYMNTNDDDDLDSDEDEVVLEILNNQTQGRRALVDDASHHQRMSVFVNPAIQGALRGTFNAWAEDTPAQDRSQRLSHNHHELSRENTWESCPDAEDAVRPAAGPAAGDRLQVPTGLEHSLRRVTSPGRAPMRGAWGPRGSDNRSPRHLEGGGLRICIRPSPATSNLSASTNDRFDIEGSGLGGGSVAVSRKALQHAIILPETNGGRAMMILPPGNLLRRWLTYVVSHPIFENTVMVMIILSSAVLAVEGPANNGDASSVFEVANIFFTVIFILEMLAKIFAFGLVFHPGAYLRDGWNRLDALVVGISVLSLVFSGFSVVKVFRALRALRPLRVVNRHHGLKLVVRTLLKSLPAVANVALIALLIYLIFGILGVQLFAGRMYRCEDPNNEFAIYQFRNETDCLMGQENVSVLDRRRWRNNPQNFDNIGVSLLTLFEVATLELWTHIMYTAVDASGVDQGPQRDASPWTAGFFFASFVVIGSFFVMNLFVGVIIWSYSVEKSNLDQVLGNMSEEQEEWMKMLRFIVTFRPKVRMLTGYESNRRIGNTLEVQRLPRRRKAACKVANAPWLEALVMSTIIINVVVMAMDHYGIDRRLDRTLQVINHICSGVFIAEAAIKIYAWRQEYFLDQENRFDFILVVLAVIGLLILTLNAESPVDPTVLRVFRIFRMARMIRLIRSSRGTKVLIETLWYSLPYLSNIGLFLMLLFFIYATLGLYLFHDVKHGEYLTYHANFDTWPTALLVLFRVSTGENWNGIMHDLMVTENCGNNENGKDKCTPHALLPPLYFITFIIIASQVLLNIFVAIILDNFATTIMFERSNLDLTAVGSFQRIWSHFDPDADLVIPTWSIPQLMEMCGPPLLVGPVNDRRSLLTTMRRLGIYDHGGLVHFAEVLVPLCRVAMEVQGDTDFIRQQEKVVFNSFPDLVNLPDKRYRLKRVTTDQFFGASFIAAAYRRRRARRLVDGLRQEKKRLRLLRPPPGPLSPPASAAAAAAAAAGAAANSGPVTLGGLGRGAAAAVAVVSPHRQTTDPVEAFVEGAPDRQLTSELGAASSGLVTDSVTSLRSSQQVVHHHHTTTIINNNYYIVNNDGIAQSSTQAGQPETKPVSVDTLSVEDAPRAAAANESKNCDDPESID
eukprot:Hpha_TRINITY_DN15595_c0_g2::TRINITY_DN15595_c0_g2_i1::g.108714::m.108714/K04842/SCN10A; voltage-gated sodium channel type X alpha